MNTQKRKKYRAFVLVRHLNPLRIQPKGNKNLRHSQLLVALSIQVVFDTIKTGIFVSISQPIRIKMFVHHCLRVDLDFQGWRGYFPNKYLGSLLLLEKSGHFNLSRVKLKRWTVLHCFSALIWYDLLHFIILAGLALDPNRNSKTKDD